MLRVPTISGTRIDRHCLHHRHGEQEHHVRAVHGEDLVVEVRARERRFGPRQLQAHQQRQHAAQGQEDEGGDDVAAADHLVVHRGERAEEAARRAPDRPQLRAEAPARIELGVARVRSSHHFRLASRPTAHSARRWSAAPAACCCRASASADRRSRPPANRAWSAAGRRRWSSRPPTWVRSGPSLPAADVPRTVWQAAQALARTRRVPPAVPSWRARSLASAPRASARIPPASRRPPATPYARVADRRTRRTGRDSRRGGRQ